MIDRFERLGHDAVVGRYHQHDDVGDFGAAGAHARERFVAGRIDEDDLAAVLLDVISADVLRDAAGFTLGDVGGPDGIEQRSLAVIDVAHDGDHRGALHAVGGLLGLFDDLRAFLFEADFVGGSAEVARDLLGHLDVEVLVDGGEDLLLHQLLDHQVGFDAELFGKLLYGDAFRDGDLAVDGRRRGGFVAPRGHPQTTLFLFLIAMAVAAARLGLMTALLLGWQRSGRLGAQWRCRVQRPGPPEAAGGCAAARRTDSRPAHNRLARTNRTAVDGLARHGR